jgi:glutathione peroxidase
MILFINLLQGKNMDSYIANQVERYHKGLCSLIVIFSLFFANPVSADCHPIMEYQAKKLHSKQIINFCKAFKDKVLLVVNTASKCGFTPQFEALEQLHQKYKSQGFEVVGFASNDFRQEYKSEADVATVCFKNFGVNFTMIAPSVVSGENQNTFYKVLTNKTGKEPKWNFNKFLISKDRASIQYFKSSAQPLNGDIERQIVTLISDE